MRSKQWLAGIVVMAVLVTLNASALAAKTTITFSAQASSPERFPVYETWAKRYHELNPDVTVDVIRVAGNYTEFLLTMMARRHADRRHVVGSGVLHLCRPLGAAG